MQILLASAKIMNSCSEEEVPMKSNPLFQDIANKIALEMSNWKVEDIAKQLKCSCEIAQENYLRYSSFLDSNEHLAAILAYNGQAFKYLKAGIWSQDDYLFAQEHLFVSSFVYGLLRPLNAIHPYRMEGKIKLKATNDQTLFDFWKPKLTDILIDAVQKDDGVLIHLATEEFEHLFDWKRVRKEVKIIQPLFYIDKGDYIKMVSVYAKSCRGGMANFIIKNKITHPLLLKEFELEGFRYDKNYGDDLHPHFIKK